MVITFNNNATANRCGNAAATSHHLLAPNDVNPTPGNRTVRYVLTDGDGGTSANVDTTVTVIAVNSADAFGAPADTAALPGECH
ncbi:MAG: hypothetical protein R2856_08050 [Caldilineaceae bacterium]